MTKAGVGALGVVLLAVLIFLVVSSWSRQPAAAKPSAQPINFPHNTHVQTYKIDCQYRSEEHTSELQSQSNLVCRLLLEKKKKKTERRHILTHTQERKPVLLKN